MKKIIALLILGFCGVAQAQYVPYGLQIYQGDSVGAWIVGRWFTPTSPTSSYILMYDGTSQQPAVAVIGSGLSWDGTTLTASGGAAQVNSDWNASSGVAQILNKPSLFSGAYADLTGKPTLFDGTWTSMTGKPSFATVATSGSYTDLSNKPTIPAAASQSAQTRSLNTAFQISTTRATLVVYSVKITVTASITGGQDGDVILEVASDSGFTTNVQTLSIVGSGQTYSLAVAIQGVQPQTSVVSGYVPIGYYTRLRTVNNTGTPTFTYRAGQEILM